MTKKCLFTIILIFLTASLVLSEEKEILLGGDEGWNSFSVAQNIRLVNSGRFGKQAVQIATNSSPVTQNTDLLLNFEQGEIPTDVIGNYSTVSGTLDSTSQSIMGNYSGLSKGNAGGIQLSGNNKSFFGREGLKGSFTISFWLNPSIVENGEIIFEWDSSRNVNNAPVYQYISIMFFQNRIEWNFTNIFSNFTNFKNILLKSEALIIPDVWTHHSVSFDESTGIIEYRINGKLDSVTYATESGWAERSVYSAVLGLPTEITLCSNYTGRIDDFTIQREFKHGDFDTGMYHPDGGYFESQPLGPFSNGSTITGITTISDTPSETDIQYFIRAGDNYYEWTRTYPEWHPVINDKIASNVRGKFFQIAVNLYTDGSGNNTPTLTEVRLRYYEAEPPLPPFRVFADSGDGYVDISWIKAAGDSADGYIVYYGEASGEYLGENALEGDSPIDVGQTDSFRINGLKNGKAYYFAVSAYSYTPLKTEGMLSKEVYARPLKGGR